DRALAELLLIDEFNLPPVEVYKILNHLKRKRDDTHLCELLLDLNTLNTTLSLTSSQQFYAFAERILRMQKAHANMSFGHFFELVLNQSGLLDNARNNKEYHVLATIKSLFDFLHERAQRIKDYNLTTFFEDLEIIHDHNIKLKIHDFNPASSQGVNMLTAFASKGLEFEYVFMPKLIDKTWGNVRNIEKLKLLALTNQITEDEKELRNEEERRLFFVGLTRAKKELILTYAEEYKDNLSYRKALPSQFITELNEKNYSKIPTQDIENNHDEILRLQTEYVEPMVFSHSEEEYLQNLLKSFKLSASALNTYLEDPQKFLYRYLIKLPEVKSKHLALGSAIHSSLEYFYRSLQTEEKKDLPYLKKVFSVALEKEFAGYPDFEATQEEGIKLLTNWYNEQENFKIPIALEYSFYGHNVYLEDIPLVGLIDKIEWIDKDSKTVKIIDYKTGSPKTSGQILKPIDGGIESNIYRQVVFYTLLSQLDRNFPYEVEQSEIQFIKLDNNKLRTVPIDVPLYDIEMLRSIIIATMTQIRNLEF
ncbi:ATP-dependent helicase, partial [Candidatus Dojkabacteria bacterium]|nr:ATP-dependent helicase [Candidatus Dojkabacteria bacterium]